MDLNKMMTLLDIEIEGLPPEFRAAINGFKTKGLSIAKDKTKTPEEKKEEVDFLTSQLTAKLKKEHGDKDNK